MRVGCCVALYSVCALLYSYGCRLFFMLQKCVGTLSGRTWLGFPCFAIHLGLFWFLALALVGEHMPALFDTAGLPPDQRSRSLSQ